MASTEMTSTDMASNEMASTEMASTEMMSSDMMSPAPTPAPTPEPTHAHSLSHGSSYHHHTTPDHTHGFIERNIYDAKDNLKAFKKEVSAAVAAEEFA